MALFTGTVSALARSSFSVSHRRLGPWCESAAALSPQLRPARAPPQSAGGSGRPRIRAGASPARIAAGDAAERSREQARAGGGGRLCTRDPLLRWSTAAALSCSRLLGTWPTTACAPPCACATEQRSSPAASSLPPPASSRWALLLPLLLGRLLPFLFVDGWRACPLSCRQSDCSQARTVTGADLSLRVRPALPLCCRCPCLKAPPGGSCLR